MAPLKISHYFLPSASEELVQVTVIDMSSAASPYFCPRHFELLLVTTLDDTKK